MAITLSYQNSGNTKLVSKIAEEISQLAEVKQIKINPYTPAALKFFNDLNTSKQSKIIENLKNYLEILKLHSGAHLVGTGISAVEEQEYVSLAAKKFNLKLSTDSLEFIERGDIVEIYLSSGIQVYRNFQFFGQCSYDLITLSTTEWFELYERSQIITHLIGNKVGEVLEGRIGLVSGDDVPRHTLRERHLQARKIFTVWIKYFSPLFDQNLHSTSGFICTSRSMINLEGSAAEKVTHL